MAVSHILSATTPDDPSYEIRPSHWNSVHAQLLTISGNTAGQSTFSGTNLVFSGGPNATLSLNGNTLVWSGGAGAAGNTGYLSDGAGVTASLGTIVVSNSNGIGWGLNGQTLTASHNGLTSQSNQAFSAQGGSSAFQTLSFNNANGFTFSNVAGAVQGSYTVPTQSVQTLGLYASSNTTAQSSSTTVDARTLSVRGAGVASVGYSAGELVISVPSGGGAGDGVNVIAAGTQTANTTGTVLFNDANNVTFGMANSSVVTASASFPAQTNQSVGFYAVGNTTQNSSTTLDARTVSFGGRGIVTVGYSNGTVQISASEVPQTNQTVGLYALGNTTQNSSTTLDARTLSFNGLGGMTVGYSNGSIQLSAPTTAAQTNQSLGLYAVGNTTAQSSSTTVDARTLSVSGLGIASVGYSAGALVVSVPSGGGAGDGVVSLGMSTEGNTAGTTGLVSSGRAIFAGTGPISLSQSVNGQSLSLSIGGPATSSIVGTSGISISTNGSTISVMQQALSGYHPYDEGVQVAGQHGQGTLHIQPIDLPLFQHDRVCMSVNWSNSSNSTGSATISNWIGIYTKNASTLSLSQSTSTSFGITFSGTGGNQSLQAGNRMLTIPWTSTWQPGNYWIGIVSRTTSGGTNGTFSQLCVSDINTNFSGVFGAASNATNQRRLGLGYFSASTAGIPNSIALSDIQGTASMAMRQPMFHWASGTA